MIVLGKKYKFTTLEEQRLRKKFGNYEVIATSNRDPQEVIAELSKYIETHGASMLVLNMRTQVHDDIVKYLTKLQFKNKAKRFIIIGMSRFTEEYLQKCYIPDDNNNLHFLENIVSYSKWHYFQKRCIDYFGVFWLFFFSWPVMLLSAVKIKQQSPGSILFRQDRVGANNEIFKCTKFRSMHENSHHDSYTRENDTRIFPFAHTMRKTRLDELPQMWNILKGEMHLIGPRTEWDILVAQYEGQIPYYNERHLVRPGITGWAQVMYPYGANTEDARQKLMYDLYYIKHWSMALELKIAWMTAMTVIRKKGI
ncbi:MAG: sugar transferase [Sulfuricurvum sp.]|nr:sugar transferase [Sulfuricurvum sp.]